MPNSTLLTHRAAIYLTVVLVLIFFSFACVLQHDFVNWDDDAFLLNNPDVRELDWAHMKAMFRHSINRTYVPLTSLSFAIEYHFFGYDPFIYHLNNLVLHMGVCAFVFLLCLRMGLTPLAAAAAAGLFGLHPMRVESVAWVTERKDVLYAFFYLLALYHYSKYCQMSHKKYFVLAVIWGILSVLAKPVAIHLFAVVLLMDWWFKREMSLMRVMEKVLIYLPMAVIAQITFSIHPHVPEWSAHLNASTLIQKVLLSIWGFIFYLRQFLLPQTLVLFYKPPQPVALLSVHYFLPMLFFMTVLLALFIFRKNRLLVFASIFYTVTIFVLIIFPNMDNAQFVGDRHMYIPSLGLCMFFGAGCTQILNRVKQSPIVLRSFQALCLSLLAAMMLKTVDQCQVWRNSITLWDHQLRHNPTEVTALAYNKLGSAYLGDEALKKNRVILNKVICLQKKALQIKPDLFSAYYDIGNAYFLMDSNIKALHYYEYPLALKPDQKEIYLQILNIYEMLLQSQPENPHFSRAREKLIEKYIQHFKEEPALGVNF